VSEVYVVDDLSRESWNSFLERFPDGNFEQCFEYGEISRRAFPRSHVVRFAAMRGDEVLGLVQGTYSRYFGFGMSLGVMRGPVVDLSLSDSVEVAERLLRALDDYARERRIIEGRVLVPEEWGFDGVFRSFGYSLVGGLNEYVVSLDGGIDRVWRSISHNKRRNIRKAMREGVEVVESRDREDLLKFYSMLRAAERRGGFSSYPLSWFEAVWSVYRPELSRVFLARWKGKDIAGVFTVVHGGTVYALAAGSFSEWWRVRPNDIMHWRVMEWACRNGYSRYYMGLVSDPPPKEGSSAWGVWRWKREWRGRLLRFRVFRKVFKPKCRFILGAKNLVQSCYLRFKSFLSLM